MTYLKLLELPRSHVDNINNIINDNESTLDQLRELYHAVKKRTKKKRRQTTTKKIGGQAPLTSCTLQTQEASYRKKREDK